MKKTLAICVLLLLVAGCEKTDQTSEAPPQEPPAPTLIDSFQGKRIHLQIPDQESNRKEEFWIQVGETDQLTGGSGDDSTTTTFARKDNSIFFLTPPEVLEIRFAKAELSAGDQVTFIEHAMKRIDDLQTIVASAADSTADRIMQGSILKIEAAQEIDSDQSVQSATFQLQAFGKALDLYQIDMNSYPPSVIGLRALMERQTDLDPSMIWGGPYLKRGVPPDPWGNAYLYEVGLNDFELQVYKIWSAGPNKKNENGEEGTDDIVVYSDR